MIKLSREYIGKIIFPLNIFTEIDQILFGVLQIIEFFVSKSENLCQIILDLP